MPGWSIRKPFADWLRAEGAKSAGERTLDVDCEPRAGTTSALALLIGNFLHLLAKRGGAPWVARPFVGALNALAGTIDARVTALRVKQAGALFANLHVTAVKA